jgi:hypothetical protein
VLSVRRRTINPPDIKFHFDWILLVALLLLGVCRLLCRRRVHRWLRASYDTATVSCGRLSVVCILRVDLETFSERTMHSTSFELFDVSSAWATPFGSQVYAARSPGRTAISFIQSSLASRSMQGRSFASYEDM